MESVFDAFVKYNIKIIIIWEQENRCSILNYLDTIIKMPSGTVQNFLLGGGWYFSGKVPVKNPYPPSESPQKFGTTPSESLSSTPPPPQGTISFSLPQG